MQIDLVFFYFFIFFCSLAENYEQHSAHALTNAEKHLSNPVNAFLVVKRFTTDWNYMVDNYVRNTNASDGKTNQMIIILFYCK